MKGKYDNFALEVYLMDDEYMAKYFETSKECTAYLLNTLIKGEELEVVDVISHKTITNLENRNAILDIYASDSTGKLYDIEIQNDKRGATPRRARYYSSLIDANNLATGKDFKDLVETWVIFIIEADFYNKGLPLYTIDRTVKEIGEEFGDGAHIMYVNGKYRGDDPIGRMLHDMHCKDPEDMKCEVLKEHAYKYKRTEGGVKEMSEHLARLFEEKYREILSENEEEKRKLKEEAAEKERKLQKEEEEKRKLKEELEKVRKESAEDHGMPGIDKRWSEVIEKLNSEKVPVALDYLEDLAKYQDL